jgi:transcriptional regulator with GAF, ATPase, and Fis domain
MTADKGTIIDQLQTAVGEACELVEQLAADNEHLRQRIAELETDLANQQARAPRWSPAEGTEDGPEAYLAALKTELEHVTDEHRELLENYSDVERQNSNFLSLYVASSQIHGTLNLEDVLRNIKEIVINLIGADRFAIYLYNETNREFRRMAGEGDLHPLDEVVPLGDNLISRVSRSGELWLDAGQGALPSGEGPIAVLPMAVNDQPIGVVTLFRLLVQKSSFDAFDMELFNLLAAHAGSALRSSSMYRRLERKNKTLQGLLELFKNNAAVAGLHED